jgi:glycosyltransferase involved in cell wall biosynthesis
MRILQLSPQLPFPPTDGGKISIYYTYKNLVELGCKVTLVALTDKSVSEEDERKYIIEGSKLITIEHDSRNSIDKIIKYFLTNKSIYIEKHYNKSIINDIEQKVDVSDFDIIHADHTNMAKLSLELGEKYNKSVGLRLHNIEYMIWKRYYDELKIYDPRRIFLLQQYKLLKKAEASYIEQTNVSFSITEVDKKRADEITNNANVIAVPAGVDLDIWEEKVTNKKPNSLVIATTFNWIHNVNAISWFLKNVQGKLRERYKDLTLRIIGKNPPNFIEEYKEIGANALGFVDDVKPYLNESQIYIAPLFVGSGIRIKILEAMALGLPVVATDISAEGINADENNGLFRANNEDEYINIISKLLDNDKLRKDASSKARVFIENNHVWKDLIQKMKKEYESILTSKRNST